VKIAKGSAIDLVLGEGTDGGETTVPDLEGLSLDEATGLIQSSSLNIGSIIFHPSVTDSLSAKVYKQNPAYAQDLSVKSGTPIDIYLK
jgi:beta-lactam-binding protein with PASTA domain